MELQQDREHSLTGSVLAAMPGMGDSRFAQAVIVLCSHSAEGAMGLMINKPFEKLKFEDLLEQLNVEQHVAAALSLPLREGGPVESHRGFVMHGSGFKHKDTVQVTPDIYMTGSVEILKAMAKNKGPLEAFMALGYAGWQPDQLEQEIQANAWLTVPADENLIFRTRPEDMWHAALKSLKVDPAMLSSSAGRA